MKIIRNLKSFASIMMAAALVLSAGCAQDNSPKAIEAENGLAHLRRGCKKTLARAISRPQSGFENIFATRAGATISSHCGPNTLGVLFITK